MKFQNVKGTRDFYPAEMAVRNWLMTQWREVSTRNGFVEYDGPTFEYLDLYKTKSGDEIVSELYHFEDRGGRQLALRPEMTPTLARMVAARAESLPKPIKWFCVPNFFRAERPQRGRLREFQQWNVDIIGSTEEDIAVADAECIFVALDFLSDIGFKPDEIEMRISSRALLAQILETLGLPVEQHDSIFAILDKRAKLPEEVYVQELHKLGLTEAQVGDLLKIGGARGPEGLRAVESVLGGEQPEGSPLKRVETVLNLLKLMQVGEYCQFDLSVVRGLAYYTGVVFEAYSKGTLKRALLGGGRYSNLLQELGGPQLSGVGFGMGDVIVLDQLDEVGKLQIDQSRVDFFVVNEEIKEINKMMAIVSTVRLKMKKSCNFSYRRVSLKKQMQQAAQHRARYAIIVGDRVAVKNMDSGEQKELDVPQDLGSEQDIDEFRTKLTEAIK